MSDLRHVEGVMTSEGVIPFALTPSGIRCPCRVVVVDRAPLLRKVGRDYVPVPLRNKAGKIVYALPGGKSWIP